MVNLFEKLELPSNLDEIVILNEPTDFEHAIKQLDRVRVVESLVLLSEVDFALIFVNNRKQLECRMETLVPKLVGDAIVWIAFPQMHSEQNDFSSLDNQNWSIFGDYQLKPVQHLELNHNWSAVRFRKTGFIKSDVVSKSPIVTHNHSTINTNL